jgi:putative ABC transport system permease protein
VTGGDVRLLGLRGLRADLRPVAAIAAVVALSAAVAAAAPPLFERARAAALEEEAAAAPARERDVEVVQAARIAPAAVAGTVAGRRALLPDVLEARTARGTLAVDSPSYLVASPQAPGLQRFLTVGVRPGLARAVEGRLPRAGGAGPVEVALVPAAAAALALAVGDELELQPEPGQALLRTVPFAERRPLAIRVVGLVRPLGEPRVDRPVVENLESFRRVRALAVTGAEGYAALHARTGSMPLTFRWHYRVEPERLGPEDVGALERDLRRLEARYGVVPEAGGPEPEARTGLARVLERYRDQERAAATVAAFAGSGFLALTLAAIVAAALAGGAAHRRALALARDRGASRRLLALPAGAAGAAVALPATLAGLVAAAVATGTLGLGALAAAAAVGLAAAAAIALSLWPARRLEGSGSGPDEPAGGRRRATAEAVVVALALVGAVSVRTSPAEGGSFDAAAAVTPLLAIVAVGILLLRLLPAAAGRAAAAAGRGGGLVAPLALRRLERERRGGLVLAVALLAAGIASFAALSAPPAGSSLLDRTRDALAAAALLGAAYAASAIVSIVIVVLRERAPEDGHLTVLGLRGRGRVALGLAELVPAALAGVAAGVVAGVAAALAVRPALEPGALSAAGAAGLLAAAVLVPAACALAVAAASRPARRPA